MVLCKLSLSVAPSPQPWEVAQRQLLTTLHVTVCVDHLPSQASVPSVVAVWDAAVIEARGNQEDATAKSQVKAVGEHNSW